MSLRLTNIYLCYILNYSEYQTAKYNFCKNHSKTFQWPFKSTQTNWCKAIFYMKRLSRSSQCQTSKLIKPLLVIISVCFFPFIKFHINFKMIFLQIKPSIIWRIKIDKKDRNSLWEIRLRYWQNHCINLIYLCIPALVWNTAVLLFITTAN